jgi:hypothetical protein
MTHDRVRAAWESELDRLELDVLRIERLVRGIGTMPEDRWSPPPGLDPLPVALVGRAQALLDRQDRAMHDLRATLAATQKQLAVTDRITGAVGPAAADPVYLDLEARSSPRGRSPGILLRIAGRRPMRPP